MITQSAVMSGIDGLLFQCFELQSGNIGVFLSRIIFARNYKKLVFLPQLSIIDTRQARKNLATKLK